MNNNDINNFVFVCCSGVFGANEVNVSIMEGQSVILPINSLEIKVDSNLEWKFRDEFITKRNENGNSYFPDKRFKDRLILDHQTGSLTIQNIRTTDYGEYQLQIRKSNEIKHIQTFNVSFNSE